MFDNIGGKIKTLANVICWIGIIISVIYGLYFISNTYEGLQLLGIAIMIIGSLISWISSFTLYGFGQLIENTDQVVRNTDNIHPLKKTQKQIMEKDSFSKSKDSTVIDHELLIKSQKKFLAEINGLSTSDLELILNDQRELYSDEEIKIMENELKSRC